MIPIFAFFLLQGADSVPPQPTLTAGAQNWLIMGCAMAAVVLLICVWFYVTMRSRDHRHSRRRHHRDTDESVVEPGSNEQIERHGRRRRRRSEEFPRNPTLAETGGLPPIRDDGRSSPGQRR